MKEEIITSENTETAPASTQVYTTASILKMTVPVAIEQLLNTSIGMINMMMVSSVGSEAVAAIGLVDSLNMLFFNVFTALATGVMVIVAQCRGRGDYEGAREAASQTYTASILAAAVTAIPLLLFGRPILDSLFGGTELGVREYASIYLFASSITYPFIAAAQTAFGIVRAEGDTRSPLVSSVVGNLCNIVLGGILIFGFDMGMLGSAIGMMSARIVSAVLISVSMWKRYHWSGFEGFNFRFSRACMMPVLSIGVPAGLDSMMFNGGKLVVATFMSGMGTAALAANGIANSLFGFIGVPGNSISTITAPIVGYFFGAKDYKETKNYMFKLTAFSAITLGVFCLILYPFTPFLLDLLYKPNPEELDIAVDILHIAMLFQPLFWSGGFVTPAALRATGDVKFMMVVSMCSMWTMRVFGGWFVGVQLGWGAPGIWVGMCLDWVVRSIFYVHRAWSGKWLSPELRETAPTAEKATA